MQRYLVALLLILAIGSFFRIYELKERMSFAHDGDLYSWIIKDIVVNKHLRLIGQQTTAGGIFIGPAYYYLLIPFFLLTKMDPIGAAIPTTIIGIISLVSYYLVFSKLFNRGVGLLASLSQAILLGPIYFDRRVVPSTPSNLWTVWYFYTIIMISRGNYSVLPILAVLISLIWHIHIALLPALIAVPVAILISKKRPSLKQVQLFIVILLITSLPLLVFEAKHGLLQTRSLIQNFTVGQAGGTGLPKLDHVLQMVSGNINTLFFYPQRLPLLNPRLFMGIILLAALFLVKKKLLTLKELVPLYVWVLGVIAFFTISSSFISEYYFNNIEIVFILITSMLLYLTVKSSTFGKLLVFTLLELVVVKNLYFFLNEPIYHIGYVERKAAVDYIVKDARLKNLPCVAVSYITFPGENVGFRYFFWLNKMHVNQPISGSPPYTIVLPEELASGSGMVQFGHVRVIPPEKIPPRDQLEESCSGQNSNLTDPMQGYTE